MKQISVFLENKTGRLAEVTKTLAANNINISSLCLADTSDFGILRIIVDEPDRAKKVLKDNGFTAATCEVIAVPIEDKPGGLAKVIGLLDEANIEIEYSYVLVRRQQGDALVIVRVENPAYTIEVLNKNGIDVNPR